MTVRVAKDYRLVFEREWHLPDNAAAQMLLADVLAFLRDALRIALAETWPRGREIVYTTSEAMPEPALALAVSLLAVQHGRYPARLRLLADTAVNTLAEQVSVAEVAGVLLDHVE